MKELDKFLELASLEDLKSFACSYAKIHKPFERDLTGFLAEKYLDEDEGASDAINRLEKAFMETIDIGDRWHSYEVTDWDEVVNRRIVWPNLVPVFIIPITVIPAVLTALIIDVKLLILPVSSEVVIP